MSHLNTLKILLIKLIKSFKIKKKKKAELEFNCTENKNYYTGLIMAGSVSFKALLWHIKNNLRQNKVKNLVHLKEYHENQERYTLNDLPEIEEVLYIINQEENLILKTNK